MMAVEKEKQKSRMPESFEDRKNELVHKTEQAAVKMILHQPFFGILKMRLKDVLDMDGSYTETAATDCRHYIWWNPRYLLSLPDERVIATCVHEILHVVFKHNERRGLRVKMVISPGMKEPIMLWNVACDYVVNLEVKEAGFDVPNGWLYDERFKGMSAEQAYDILDKEVKEGEILPPGQGGGQLADDHSYWEESPGGMDYDKPLPPPQWEKWVEEAAQAAAGQGHLPSGVGRLLDELRRPVVDWRGALATFFSKDDRDDYTYRKQNRRHMGNGIILPSLKSERREIGVALDTSGSISKGWLTRFVSEVRGLSLQYDVLLHIWCIDDEIQSYILITKAKQVVEIDTTGKGGTDFRPVFEDIKKRGLDLSGLIFFTDTYGSFPEFPPTYPVLWMVTGSEERLPWGMSMRVSIDS